MPVSLLTTDITTEIADLKRLRHAVILAHNYQIPEIQDLADFVGDSLGLSQAAAHTDAEVIVFCGVHFMAETAAILCPERTVLIPDPQAGCSLAATITAEQLRAWKAEHPGAVVVSYVNTSAEVKAESDYCCTSGNAVKVIQAIPADREVLFLPDMFLGIHLERVTGRKLHLWMGECHVHAGIGPQDLLRIREAHPEAELLIHPECGCASTALYGVSCGVVPQNGVAVLSTEGIIRHARSSTAREFLIATEVGILHRLRRDNPDKTFYPVSESAVCQYMKMITLEKLARSLRDGVYEVRVPTDVADRARGAILRMLELA
ncbi:MAG: quinolinate synthase NadA [Chloroflexi bacterium]|nr:quinolinate synthase NadA [Chloroflexota bacterium]